MLAHLEAKIITAEYKDLVALLSQSDFSDSFCSALKNFLPSKRWYSAKDDVLKSVSIEAVAPISDGTVFTIIGAHLASGAKLMFLIPLRLAFGEKAGEVLKETAASVICPVVCGEENGIVFDAAGESDFASGLLSMMAVDAEKTVGKGIVLKTSATAKGKADIDSVKGLPQKMMGVEQSNTSLIVGKKIMLKMYRRVAFGENPEIATSSFLTEKAGFANTPAYLGKAELYFDNGKMLAIAVLQEFVPNQGDGWGYTMEYLKSVFDQALKKQVSVSHEEYLKTAYLLGKRTAEMHQSFAKGTGSVFEPDPVCLADLADWEKQVIAQTDRTIAVAEANVGHLSGDTRRKVQALIDGRSKIVKRIKELMPSKGQGAKTRFHGDYHLGQVVVVDGDFYILDFEGEPLRPIEERQNRHSVLKDVAGMVRSFDYAAFGAVLMYVLPQNRAAMLPVASEWQKQATKAFLHGYFDNMNDAISLPVDKEDARKLLDLFVLEKALYEVIYEVANRPDWLSIPMNGLARLIDLDGE